jgi:hypothetical protein
MNDLVPINNRPVSNNTPNNELDAAEVFRGIMGLMFDIEVVISDSAPKNTLTIDRQSYNRLKHRYEERNNA